MNAVVLSGGSLADGKLDERTVARVDRGIQLLADNHVQQLIMAGGHGAIIAFRENGFYDIIGRQTSDQQTQGALMLAYARHRGVPRSKLLLQDVSRDTVGEILFTAQQYLAQNSWRQNILVANISQTPRALFLARRILGPTYETLAAPTFHDSDLQPEVLTKEQASLETFLSQFGDVTAGNLAAFETRLYERHGLYKNIPFAQRPAFRSAK